MSLHTDALLFSIVLMIMGLQAEVATFVDAYFYIFAGLLLSIIAFGGSIYVSYSGTAKN